MVRRRETIKCNMDGIGVSTEPAGLSPSFVMPVMAAPTTLLRFWVHENATAAPATGNVNQVLLGRELLPKGLVLEVLYDWRHMRP